MVKLIETWTPKEGEPRVKTKQFATRGALKKTLQRSAVPTKVCSDLLRFGKSVTQYQDGTNTIVLEETPKLIILPGDE